jgi:LacI family transcriptional regulator
MISTRELAELAQVSQSTISRCLNDHPSISFETKERVRKLALQYGYVETAKGKKALFSGKRRTIGILITGHSFFDDLFINYTLNLLMTKAAEKNYYTIPLPLSSHEEGGLEKLRDLIRLNIVDSFIILHRHFDQALHQYLVDIGIPHVYLLHCARNSYQAVDIIDSDNYVGGYLGTQHLISHGHKDIVTITCPYREFEDRTSGYRQALVENGIPYREDFVLTVDTTYASAYQAIQENLNRVRQASAIYVQSDILTLGVVNALQDAGLKIPEDFSIVGSDGYELGIVSRPQLDSVAHPIGELVDLSLSRLIEISEKKQQTPRQIILRPYVIQRGSVTRKE